MIHENRKISPRALELLDASDEERLTHIKKSTFIPYTCADDILNEMEDLLEHPQVHRMPNLLIIGRSNNGKTELLMEFLKRHEAENRLELDKVYAPVVYVQSPPGPSEHIFLNQLLMILGVPVRQNDSADRKLIQLTETLRGIQTKVLMIDELNALLAGSVTRQRFFLNLLKYISNDLKISIVAAGTIDARNAVGADMQIKSRFPERILPRWNEDKTFRQLLYSMEYVTPLKKQSNIHKGEIARKIYGLSEGVIGAVSKIVMSSARDAILKGEEKITMDIISQCDYVRRQESSEVEII